MKTLATLIDEALLYDDTKVWIQTGTFWLIEGPQVDVPCPTA